MLQITFDNPRLQKLANNKKELTKKYGDKVAAGVQRKLTQLQAFDNLAKVPTTPPFSRHNLNTKYKGCVGIDVLGRANPMRIVLKPIDEEGNQVSLENYKEVTKVVVIFIGDYH